MHDHSAGGDAHDYSEPGGHDHGHAHGGHGHSHAPKSFGKAFAIGTTLNFGFVIVEAIYGIASGSMALVADAGHNLGDVLGLLVAWGAAILSRRSPKGRYTYGLRSSSILAALFNAVLLLAAIGVIGVEAIRRLFEPAPVAGWMVMIVAAVGIVINGVTALLFMQGRKGDLNIRGAFLHMASDAAVSAGVVVAGFIILKTGWVWLDPLVSLILVAVGTWGLLRDSVNMSLQAAPAGIDPERVGSFLRKQRGVKGVHDLHVWPMSTTETALTVHLLVPEGYPGDAFTAGIAVALKERFEIHHATVQIETDPATPCELESDKTV